MSEGFVPGGPSETEFVEKRSRFIGHVWPARSEEEARAHIEQTKKKYHDARHNCWCYRLRGGAERCSDDGEPQGTAGQPILSVFQKEGVVDVVCVVTRYFGGVLLGAGGLVRAYTRSARDALSAAGVCAMRRWVEVTAVCPYCLFERVKLEVETAGGVLGESEYAAAVTVRALLPEGAAAAFSRRFTELTAGASAVQVVGEVFRAVPRSGP